MKDVFQAGLLSNDRNRADRGNYDDILHRN